MRHYERSLKDVWENRRVIWKPSPDSEEIRQHLLTLLESVLNGIDAGVEAGYWLPGPPLEFIVIYQLAEF